MHVCIHLSYGNGFVYCIRQRVLSVTPQVLFRGRESVTWSKPKDSSTTYSSRSVTIAHWTSGNVTLHLANKLGFRKFFVGVDPGADLDADLPVNDAVFI